MTALSNFRQKILAGRFVQFHTKAGVRQLRFCMEKRQFVRREGRKRSRVPLLLSAGKAWLTIHDRGTLCGPSDSARIALSATGYLCFYLTQKT